MNSTASTEGRLGVALVLILGMACDGQRIRLGDGLMDVSPEAGLSQPVVGGSSGVSVPSTSLPTVSLSSTEAAPPTCQRGAVQAEEVLWIGDSWVVIPGVQHTRVRDLARESGVINPDEDYVDLAANGADLDAIVAQYVAGQAGMLPVKVLIMDGGTWDTLIANGSAASVTRVANGFREFLAQVANDGTVQHLIYFLPPELPANAGIPELRPLLQSACSESSVPCYFIDLDPLWLGHPEYTARDGIQASEAGATVIADAIWRVMQDNCIAQ